MKIYAHRLKLGLATLAVLMLGMVLFGSVKGYAQPGGRAVGCGYFDNNCLTPFGNDLYTPVFDNGIDPGLSSTTGGATESKPKFIAFMKNMLNGTAKEQTGAAFLIDLMMPGNSRNRNPNVNNWAAAVNQANITIKFNNNQSFLGWNSGYQDIWHPSSGTFTLFANDDAFFPEVGSAPAIDFWQSGKLIFVIKESCGNPLGNMAGMNVPPPQPQWDLQLNTTVSVTNVEPGDTVTWAHTIHNAAGSDPATFNHRVEYSYASGTYTDEAYFAANKMPAGNTITAVRTFQIPANAVAGSLYCQRIHVDDADGKGNGATSAPKCVRVIVLTCSNGVTTPDPLQPGDSITNIKVSMKISGAAPAYTGMKLTIDPPFGGGGYTATATGGNVVVAGGTITGTFTGLPNTPITGADNYTMTWQLMNGAAVVFGPCNGGLGTRNLPYFSVFGASVSAGGDFDDNGSGCANAAGDGTISSWYNNQTAFAGASTFLAAVALGQVTGFGSAQFHTGGATGNRPDGLSFANTGGGVNISTDAFLPKLGGNFAGVGNTGTSCLFTPKLPAGTPTVGAPATPVDVSTLSAAAHSYTGNVTLTGGAGIPAANNVSVFVKGNVFIDSNLIYALGGWSVTPGGKNVVPSFTLKVTGGNIYIADTVDELDGMYVAEANAGTGGSIYTCGTAYAPDPATGLAGCNTQLDIYGSFVADQVNLMRTYGTLRNATSTDQPSGPAKLCSGGPNNAVCAGEVFEASPELYLSSPAIQQPSNSPPTYNSISSLPPIL